MSFESVRPCNCRILCCPLLLLPSVFPSIRVFSSESALLIKWPKCWSFSFNINPSNEYLGLIFYRTGLISLGTLKSLLQNHSSKASILLSSVKQIASPGWMHETSAQGWCTGMTQRGGRWEGGSGWGMHVNP